MVLVTPQSGLTRSHGCLYEPNDNHRDSSQYMGFEQMWQNNNYHSEVPTLLLLSIRPRELCGIKF